MCKIVLPLGWDMPAVTDIDVRFPPTLTFEAIIEYFILQRMNSIEAYTAANDKGNSPDDERRYKLMPGKLSLRKASVDDLRRLYEDRVSTVRGLARVEGVKRSNSQS